MTTNHYVRQISPSVTYRTIQTHDIGALRRMFERCSRLTVYRRFCCFYPSAIPDRVLQRLTFVDYVNRHAVVAVVDEEVVGLAGFEKVGKGDEAEVAICVEDAWQREGVGRALLDQLLEAALRRGVMAITAYVHSDNRAARALLGSALPDAEVSSHGTTLAVRTAL